MLAARLFFVTVMAKHISGSPISRLLRESVSPVYVLDENQTLVYFNPSLLELTGCEEQKLLGQVCRYHTSPSRLHHEIIAAALAPPAEVLLGKRTQRILSLDAVKVVHLRKAEFYPIPLAAQTFGTLVFLGPNDLSEEEAARFFAENSREDSATVRASELHRLLFMLHRYQAGQYRLERFLGHNPEIALAREQARLAASCSAPVLILGASGVGKESLANAIHFGRDGENAGGVIPVDCQMLSAELIESTIRAFRQRYERTGNTKRNTLLLTNIDRIAPELEPILLSLLTNSEENMRMIGTSSVEPHHWEKLRELPHHLGVITIKIPTLAQRRSDIPILAQWFLEQQNAQGKVQKNGFSPDAMDLLLFYQWPENIDELIDVVTEAHAAARETLVRVMDIPSRLHHAQQARTVKTRKKKIDLEKYLRKIETELVRRALKSARGNKAEAARLLGMNRPRLYRRMEQLGLIKPPSPDSPPQDRREE